jgi:hypothetical protein
MKSWMTIYISGNLFTEMAVKQIRQKTLSKSIALALCSGFVLLTMACRTTSPPPVLTNPTPTMDAYKEAKDKVEAARGEPVGRKAQIKIPAQLQHYPDRRRFLAIQYAAWRQLHNEIPQGFLELLELIQKGGLVEMPLLGDDYILYGVGEMTDTEPFSYYDAATGESITLYADNDEFMTAQKQFDNAILQLQNQIAELQIQLALATGKAAKNSLLAQSKERQEKLSEISLKKNLFEIFYKDVVRREMLFARYRWLTNLAADFRGKSYDIKDPAERRAFKMRLLSFLRPEARALVLQIAAIYKERFGRHLPVTSLIRTVQYQSQLRETNANAANVAVPPHTTGLAFDVFNAWMTAEEQGFLMNVIAKFETAGRLEALRENRDHIHLFAFYNGKPPDENHVEQALK